MKKPMRAIDLPALIERVKDRYIAKALKETGGVKSRAADLLGMNRPTLIMRLKRQGKLAPKAKKQADECCGREFK